MDNLQQQLSLNDSSIHGECTEPSISSDNETKRSFEELYDQQIMLVTKAQLTEQLIDSAESESSMACPSEVVPTLPVVIPSVNHHDINHLSESGKGVEQVTGHEDTTLQQVVDVVDQKNDTNIDLQILSPPKNVKRKRRKENWRLFHIDIPTQFNEPLDKMSEVCRVSTEFIYGGNIIPVHVNQFDNIPIIGKGSFGQVHMATIDGLPDGRMAVKCISRIKDENGQSSADVELAIMKNIGSGNTPHVVNYYGHVTNSDANRLYMCMEWMDTSMDKFYRAMHSLDEVASNQLDAIARHIAYTIASALRCLATKNIVHRDVKPANMLINKNGEIKLCDFGISADLSKKSDYLVVEGTTKYLAPNPEPCAIENDMWALGMSLLEIISGQHPLIDWTANDTPINILDWKPTIPKTVSKDVQELITDLLKKDSKERPRSYDDILQRPFMCNMSPTPSNDLREFIHHIIKKTA